MEAAARRVGASEASDVYKGQLRTHPVPKVTIAGGVAKMTKLAQGFLDLHSKRGSVDLEALAEVAVAQGGSEALRQKIVAANTTPEAFAEAEAEGIRLGDSVAQSAWDTAAQLIAGTDMALEIVVFDREGNVMGRRPFAPVHDVRHDAPRDRKRR